MINRILSQKQNGNGLQPSPPPNQAMDLIGQQVGKARDAVEQCIATYPGLTIGAALAAGVFIGWLVKRK